MSAYDDIVLSHEPLLYAPMKTVGSVVDNYADPAKPLTQVGPVSTHGTTVDTCPMISLGGATGFTWPHIFEMNFNWSIEFWEKSTSSGTMNTAGSIFSVYEQFNRSIKLKFSKYTSSATYSYKALVTHGFSLTALDSASDPVGPETALLADYTTNYTDTSLYHWVITSGLTGGVVVYRNGVPHLTSGAVNATYFSTCMPTSRTLPFAFGCSPLLTEFSNWSAISHVALYGHRLTASDVALHYAMATGGATNRIAGTVLLDGTGTQGFPVRVYRRDTGALLGTVMSDGNGAFSMPVGSYSGTVYALCTDTVTGKPYNAQVFDLLTPAP